MQDFYRIRRLPPYVFEEVNKAKAKARNAGADIIDLGMSLNPETELSLGLVHFTDGAAGTRKRLATAERHAKAFSIATECGFGRRDPKTIPELLRIHAEIAG